MMITIPVDRDKVDRIRKLEHELLHLNKRLGACRDILSGQVSEFDSATKEYIAKTFKGHWVAGEGVREGGLQGEYAKHVLLAKDVKTDEQTRDAAWLKAGELHMRILQASHEIDTLTLRIQKREDALVPLRKEFLDEALTAAKAASAATPAGVER